MADFVFNRAKFLLATGDLDWENDDIRALLVKGVAPSDPSVDFVGELLVGVDELTHASYDRVEITDRSVVQNDVDDRAECHGDAIDFEELTGGEAVLGIVVFAQVATDSDSPLIAFYEQEFTAGVPAAGRLFTPTATGYLAFNGSS